MLFPLRSILVIILSSTLFISCNNAADKKEPDPVVSSAPPTKELLFDKLTGVWKSTEGNSFERWEKNADGSYRYVAFSVKGTDTSWNEHADIYPENDHWIFENTVKGQNNGKAIKFSSILLNSQTVQFSNPEHDFPTDINYTVADANTVNAFIVGPNNKGGKDTIPFNYTRLK